MRGIYTLAVTNTPSVFRKCLELVSNRQYVRAALGLHPELVHERMGELDLFPDLLRETRYVGEIGLDYGTNDSETRRLQRRVFATILEAAADSGDKVLTIHSRRAAKDAVEMIGTDYPGTVILHWYSGPLGVLDAGITNGCYFSVNPSMILSASGQAIIRHIPRDRVLLETDGPFVRVHGQPACPRDVEVVIPHLSNLWVIPIQDVHATLAANLRRALTKRHGDIGQGKLE